MRRILFALIAILMLSGSVSATTFYIRVDGGTQTQCTGTTNSPYPGVGTGVACAFNHPYEALHHNALPFTWNMAPGDTMQFEDQGPYYTGQGPKNGLGQSWPACVGDEPDCDMPINMPAGVHILGVNAGACHTAGHTGLVNPTVLSGINGVFWVWSLQGSVSADFECIKITQPDTCTKGGQSNLTIVTSQLTSGVATYGFTTPDSSEQPPVPTELINIQGTTNDSGALNFIGRNISTVTFTSFNITGSQVVAGDLIITYSGLVGMPLRNGDGVALSGLVNPSFDFGGTPTGGVSISSVTGSTFHIAGFGLPTTGFQVETGTGIDNWSGHFTVGGFSGTVGSQNETGTSAFGYQCNSSNNYATNGLVMAYQGNQGPKNLTIADVGVEGIASEGILGSHYNTTSGDTLNMSDIYVYASGTANLDGDGGGCSTNCESIGTMNLNYVDLEWAGCAQVSPGVYTACIDQAFSGNGDNLVLVATGGTWNFNHVTVKHGTQDGFDSFHTGDDPSNLPTLVANYVYSEGNEGQSIKMSGGDVTIRNSIGISNCKVMTTASNFPSFPTGWNAFIGLPCRANNSMAFTAADGHTTTIQNVDNIGQQTVGWDFVNIGPTGCAGATCKVVFQNNTTLAFAIGGGGTMSGIYLGDVSTNPFANTGSHIDHNNWFNVSNGCPNVSPYETNEVCGDPLFVAESDVNAINANLTSSSPLRGAGTTLIAATSPDFNGNTRPSPEAIGFVEFVGGTTVATPVASPVAGTYTSAQTVTLSTSTGGATICYTTNGATPGASTAGTCDIGSTTYSGPFTVGVTTTINAIGTLIGDTNSSVFSGLYTISPVIATPTAAPPAGAYASAQSVSLSTVTGGATICYTVDGSTPTATAGTCTHGTTYSSAIAVATTQTINALGTESGFTNSGVFTGLYTIILSTTPVSITGPVEITGGSVTQ